MKYSKTRQHLFLLFLTLLFLITLFFLAFMYNDESISEKVLKEVNTNKNVLLMQITEKKEEVLIIEQMCKNNYRLEFEVYEIEKNNTRKIALGFVVNKKRNLQEVRELIAEVNLFIEEYFGNINKKYIVNFKNDIIEPK